MTLLKDYTKTVDYFICPEGKIPNSTYQKHKELYLSSRITEDIIHTFTDKVVYIFFTSIDKNVMSALCDTAKIVYFVNNSSPENIDCVCNLSSCKNNFHSFLTNMNVDDYMKFIDNLN